MVWLWGCLGVLCVLLGIGAAAEAICEARDRARFPPPGQMVDVGGRRLHLLCKGTARGPTVVIEQGAGSPSILWWSIQDKVASFARVCTYDRAGYQWSDPAARVRSLEERVADLHAVLADGQVPGPYVMVAHSFGGPLIRLFARTHPDEVAGMVLVDTPEEAVILRPSYGAYCRKVSLVASGLKIAARFGLVRLAATFMTGVPDGFDAHAFQALKAMVVRPGLFRAMADDPRAFRRQPGILRSLGGAGALGNTPLVVITHGQPFPGSAAILEEGWVEGQHRLAALSSQSELVVAERSNHMVQSDQPELVIGAINRVVDIVRAGADDGSPPTTIKSAAGEPIHL
jgi:pimeloyl-ACP methyl ester carboxylesterase